MDYYTQKEKITQSKKNLKEIPGELLFFQIHFETAPHDDRGKGQDSPIYEQFPMQRESLNDFGIWYRNVLWTSKTTEI